MRHQPCALTWIEVPDAKWLPLRSNAAHHRNDPPDACRLSGTIMNGRAIVGSARRTRFVARDVTGPTGRRSSTELCESSPLPHRTRRLVRGGECEPSLSNPSLTFGLEHRRWVTTLLVNRSLSEATACSTEDDRLDDDPSTASPAVSRPSRSTPGQEWLPHRRPDSYLARGLVPTIAVRHLFKDKRERLYRWQSCSPQLPRALLQRQWGQTMARTSRNRRGSMHVLAHHRQH
jgi:hypothetical protein